MSARHKHYICNWDPGTWDSDGKHQMWLE